MVLGRRRCPLGYGVDRLARHAERPEVQSRHVLQHRSMPANMLVAALEELVRTTLAIDDDLLEEARRLSGLEERTPLVREGLKALIERESARRLARLGGSEPGTTRVPRRRPPVDEPPAQDLG